MVGKKIRVSDGSPLSHLRLQDYQYYARNFLLPTYWTGQDLDIPLFYRVILQKFLSAKQKR